MEDLASNAQAAEAVERAAAGLIAEAKGADAPDLKAIVSEAVQRADGDMDEATSEFMRMVRTRHPAYYVDMQTRAVRALCRALIRSTANDLRNTIAATGGQPSQQGLGADSMLAVARGWLDWPVAAGVPLRSATREQVKAAATKYLNDARVYVARGSWLEAIARKLRDDKTTVAQALTESDIAALAKKHGVSKEA